MFAKSPTVSSQQMKVGYFSQLKNPEFLLNFFGGMAGGHEKLGTQAELGYNRSDGIILNGINLLGFTLQGFA